MPDPDPNNTPPPIENLLRQQVPSAWQTYLPVVTSLVRDGLKYAGAGGFVWANTVSGSQTEMIACALMAAAGTIWSQIQKARAKRALAIAAATPASATVPALPA